MGVGVGDGGEAVRRGAKGEGGGGRGAHAVLQEGLDLRLGQRRVAVGVDVQRRRVDRLDRQPGLGGRDVARDAAHAACGGGSHRDGLCGACALSFAVCLSVCLRRVCVSHTPQLGSMATGAGSKKIRL